MSRNRTILTVIGFLLAGIGLLSIFMTLIGLNFTYLSWLKSFGPIAAFAIKISITVVGFILIYVTQTDWDQEEV